MKEANVLLLSMSTLQLPITEYSYVYEDMEYRGQSQLEPITKLLVDGLKVRLNRIVIMATDATLEEKKVMVSGEVYNISAVDFYKKRVEGVCKEAKVISVRKPPVVTIDFYWNVISEIKGDNDEKINLYMDMQGGDRNAIAQTNAIVSLLKNQGVKLCGRYAIDFNKQKEIQPIRRVDEEYRIYDLISAMEMFRRYGRGQGLLNYFENCPKTGGRDVKLINAIEQVSNAIRLCDVDGFEKALVKIKQLKEQFLEKDETGEMTEMDIVFKDIYDDYRDLLPDATGESRTIKQIEWCRKKGLLQQALTLIEGKMPMVICNKVISYDMNKQEEVSEKTETGWRKAQTITTLGKFVEETKRVLGKTWESDDNFLVNQWANSYRKECYMKFGEAIEGAQEPETIAMQIKVLMKGIGNKVYIRKKQQSICFGYRFKKPTDNQRFMEFMFLHSFLKKQRNIINHGITGEDMRCDANRIETLIDTYLEYACSLEMQ